MTALPSSSEALRGDVRDSHEMRALRRAAAAGGLPSAWLDRLLVVATELPIAQGEAAVARAMVDAIATMLPDHAIGACLVPPEGGAQQLVCALPQAGSPSTHSTHGVDPVRVFPAYPYERVVALGAEGGSTLHVASSSADCEDDDSAIGALIGRAAMVARSGLELARQHVRATLAASELRALHAQIVQTEKLASLGQIAAGVVHELNNPLTSIVAYADFLVRKASRRTAPADADEIDRLKRISESAGRMLRFTRDLVSYARPSSELSVPVDVHPVIDQALAFCEHVLGESGASVERRFGASLPPVHGKPEQLAQVFVNLITNACHAMPAGSGRLVIATECDGHTISIVVADNGHGISAEHVTRVFTPFFTTKGSGSGTGLGLTIVKSILDAHGASIDVRSTCEGPRCGTTFTIRLPTR